MSKLTPVALIVILLGLLPSPAGASRRPARAAAPTATTPSSLTQVAKPSSYDNSVVRAPDTADR